MRSRAASVVGLVLLLLSVVPALAEMTPAPPKSRMPPAPSAEGEYARGVAATKSKEWSVAEAAFGRAVEMKADYAEAWNGLGYALRNQGKYPASLKAYDEALRLKPDYPDALEYLGEAYVKMGRIEDARRVLERLRPLDGERARELSEAIVKGR
jgi:tetratricopeptide (TPR) repeat protein